MPNGLHMMLFDIDGKAEVRATQGTPPAESKDEGSVVNILSKEAETICDRIERGVKKHLDPYITVQANIQFEQGSLLITGTVAIFAWAGSVVLEAAKAEIQQQIANLVKLVVQRVINRAIGSLGLQSAIASMEMSVTPQQFTGASRADQVVAGTTPSIQPGQASPPDDRSAFQMRRHVYVLYTLFAFVFLAEVILTLSRFFAVRLK
jgi:hypothetical protein